MAFSKNSKQSKVKFGWYDIDWTSVKQKVFQQQVKIGVAYENGNIGLVTQLQDNLTRSWEARALAVRTVTTNKGKDTAGIDDVTWDFRAWDKRCLKFVKKQKYLCPVCEELLEPQQQIELHHILAKSKGASEKDTNLVALHKACHKQVTHSNNPSLLARFKEKGILKSACWLY